MAKERIYPFAVASVRSMENKLLTKQKLLQRLRMQRKHCASCRIVITGKRRLGMCMNLRP